MKTPPISFPGHGRADLSHELLAGEDELVVDDPARSVVDEAAARVNGHRLLVLDGLVVAAGPAQTRRVVEEARRDRLHNARRRRRPPAISAPVVKLLSKRRWIPRGVRPEGQKLEPEGAESRGGVPNCRPGVIEHSRHSVWLLRHLSSV